MEEESTFYPHYEIPLKIQELLYLSKSKTGNSTNLQIQSQLIRIDAIPKAIIQQWCDENLGKEHYHLGRDKVVVYSEINVMAVTLRWK